MLTRKVEPFYISLTQLGGVKPKTNLWWNTFVFVVFVVFAFVVFVVFVVFAFVFVVFVVFG